MDNNNTDKKVNNKIFVVLLIIIFVLLFINYTVKKFEQEEMDIKTKIGPVIGNSTVTINEFTLVSERTIGLYLKYLRENKIEEAYSLLSYEYKQYVPLDDFKAYISNTKFSKYSVNSITRKTENMYLATLDVDGEKQEMLIILVGERFCIVPEPFLKYVIVNEEISKDGVKYILEGYKINVNSCIFDVKIINDKNEDIIISGSNIKLSSGYTINAEGTGNADFTVSAKQEKDVKIVFETSLDFPVQFEIDREDGEKIRMYNFKLD